MKAPFWGGACKVKSCCEEKGLDHCGQCSVFPCDMLKNMGREQGYDSEAKIEQCKKWAEEEAAAAVATMPTPGLLGCGHNRGSSEVVCESMEKGVEACNMMGIDRIMVSSFFDTMVRSDYDFDNFARHLNYLCDLADDHGVKVSFESVMSIERILRMLEATRERAGVCYDIHNPLRYGTGDPVQELLRLGMLPALKAAGRAFAECLWNDARK